MQGGAERKPLLVIIVGMGDARRVDIEFKAEGRWREGGDLSGDKRKERIGQITIYAGLVSLMGDCSKLPHKRESRAS